MAQFDVFANPVAASRGSFPWLVEVQHSAMSRLNTRLVMPLQVVKTRTPGSDRAAPHIVVQGQSFRLAAALSSPVAATSLRNPVDNVAQQRDAIIAAMDVIFTGA